MNEEIRLNQLITVRDLQLFEEKLLAKLQSLLGRQAHTQPEKAWLKSREVRNLMHISPGTLQTLRVKGILAYKKVGGSMYYRYEDVVKLMNPDSMSLKSKE